jgi:hypothetical protein
MTRTHLAGAAALAVFLPIAAQCATLPEQNLCSIAAERMFKKLGYHEDKNDMVNFATFMSHYNEKTQQCFLGVEKHSSVGNMFFTVRQIIDASAASFTPIICGIPGKAKNTGR